MRKLIAVTYDTEFKAEEVRLQFLKMQKSYLVSLEDAVVVEKKQNGKVKLHQMYNLTASGAVGGGFWGVLIGLIFMNPLLGLVVGAGAGAVAGALSDVGINDDFMKQLAEKLTPGTSALFVLVDSDLTDKVLDALRGTGGTVLQSSLSHEDEAKLQAALNSARAAQKDARIAPLALQKGSMKRPLPQGKRPFCMRNMRAVQESSPVRIDGIVFRFMRFPAGRGCPRPTWAGVRGRAGR